MNDQLLESCYNLLLDYKSLLECKGEIHEADVVLDILEALENELED